MSSWSIAARWPATPSINEDVQTAITGISITDVDADPANQDVTVTFSVAHGTLNVLTNVANGILASDITGGAEDSNTITITAPQNLINATIAGLGGRAITKRSLHHHFAAAIAGETAPLTFLDLNRELVERELARLGAPGRSGPHAENMLRDLGAVAAGPV